MSRTAIKERPQIRQSEHHSAALGLAVFRVAFCTLVLWDLTELAVGSLWPLNSWYLLLPASVTLACMFGWKPAGFVLVVSQIVVAAVVPGFHTQDTVLIMGAWLVALLPVNRRPSVIPGNAVLLTGVVVGLVYLDSGVRKALSPMWRAGLGVWAPASIPHAIHGRIPFLDVEPVMLLAGYAVIVFEVLWLPMYTVRRFRRSLAWAGIAFHLAISMFYPFHIFSGAMIALLLPSAVYNWRAPPAPSSPTFRRVAMVWAGLSLVILAGVVPAFRVVAASTQQLLFPVTGLYMRGVFDDSLFESHGFQWGTDHWSDTGFLERSVMNRTWETWWKTEHIKGPPPGVPVRYLEVSLTEHVPGLLTRNLAAEWTVSD